MAVTDGLTGRRVDVYWNFHKEYWSIKSMETEAENYGNVIAHEDRVLVDDPTFVVQKAGLDKYRATGKRNLHAFIRGTTLGVGAEAERGEYRTWEFSYEPLDDRYKHLDTPFVFYEVPSGRPATSVNPDRVLLTERGSFGLFDYTVSV